MGSDGTTRRRFFRHVVSETFGLIEEFRGRPQMRLDNLDKVPDDIVRQMVPVFNTHCAYMIENDRVLFCDQKTGTTQKVRQLHPGDKLILDSFDGRRTIEVISQRLVEQSGESADDAYQRVKTLFICLAKYSICFPADPHERPEE